MSNFCFGAKCSVSLFGLDGARRHKAQAISQANSRAIAHPAPTVTVLEARLRDPQVVWMIISRSLYPNSRRGLHPSGRGTLTTGHIKTVSLLYFVLFLFHSRLYCSSFPVRETGACEYSRVLFRRSALECLIKAFHDSQIVLGNDRSANPSRAPF